MNVKAFIEIPLHSIYKYELDKDTNTLLLDRPLNQPIPANYGFIPNTLAEDGDPLDVFIVTNEPLVPGSYCRISIRGIMLCKDQGIADHKIIASLEDEILDPVPQDEVDKIKMYLKTYKFGFEYVEYKYELDALEELELCKQKYLLKS